MPTKPKTAKIAKTENETKRVAPGATKRLRQFASEETANSFTALRVGAIDAAVRANHQTVQIVDQTRIARLRARDGEIGSGATIDAAQFAHFVALQTPQRSAVEQLEQILEPLPGVLALVDEAIGRHNREDTRFAAILSGYKFKLMTPACRVCSKLQ